MTGSDRDKAFVHDLKTGMSTAFFAAIAILWVLWTGFTLFLWFIVLTGNAFIERFHPRLVLIATALSLVSGIVALIALRRNRRWP